MLARPPHAGTPQPRKRRRGATAIEYAFCLSLILVLLIAGARSLSGMLKNSVTNTSDKIKNIVPAK